MEYTLLILISGLALLHVLAGLGWIYYKAHSHPPVDLERGAE